MTAQDARTDRGLFLRLTIAGCFIYTMSGGLRNNFGIMLGPVSAMSGLSYEAVSFVIAVAQLTYGLSQPLFGALGIRTSNFLVLVLGALLTVTGMLLTPFCRQEWTLLISLGILVSAGISAMSFGVIMAELTPRLGQEKAALASGFVNASLGVGSTLLAPVIQLSAAGMGLFPAFVIVSVPTLCVIPAAMIVCRNKGFRGAARARGERADIGAMFAEAFRNRTYLLLCAGFFTCGFHMSLFQTHFFSQCVSFGLNETIAAIAFSVYGVASIIGSVATGMWCTRYRMKQVLGALYAVRVIAVAGFVLLPPATAVCFLFGFLVGFSGPATVVPTAGLTNRAFGPARLAALFGFCYLVHQLGGFFSSWAGGICFGMTGSYDLVWIADAILCALAAAASFSIAEEKKSAAGQA